MKVPAFSIAVCIIVLAFPTCSWATPSRGSTCVGCHGSSAPDGNNDNRLTLQNTTGTVDPVERVGATDRGTLPFYQVMAGTSKALSLLTNGAISPNYGFVTNNYQKLGVVNGNTPSVTNDPAWFQQSAAGGPFWYRTTYSTGTTYNYNITIPGNVLPDFYEFEMGWAGAGGNDAGLKRMYIQVISPVGAWNKTVGGNWSTAANWSGPVPNVMGATATLTGAIAGAATVTTDVAVSVETLNLDNVNSYTIGGVNALTLDAITGSAAINVLNGSHTISAPLTLADDATITVTPPASVLSLTGALTATARTITKNGDGTVRSNNVRAAGLIVNAGSVVIPSNGSDASSSRVGVLNVAEAAEHGAFTRPQALELEAMVRARLAALGVDAQDNYAKSAELNAASREAEEAPRLARSSSPPLFSAEDPVWRPLFLDESDLPDHAGVVFDDAGSAEPTFAACGGLRAGQAVWAGDQSSAIAQVVDTRWVFRTASAADAFLRQMLPAIARGLPAVAAPRLGDEAFAFGTDIAPRAHAIVVRVGRVIACLQASEGARAAEARQILHAATLHRLADIVARRARHGLAAYWLEVASPSNAVPALVHSPGYDAARLLERYPMLAHAELPAAIASRGESYVPVARSLASFQAQLRAHRWATYRDAMLALVRQLLDSDMGDARVNVSHALEIIGEIRFLDGDPMWARLEAECRARI